VAQRKEEAHADRLAPILEQLSRRVVDGGDVIGVESVPKAERVSEPAQRKDRRIAGTVNEQEAPPGDVEHADTAEEARQTAAFAPIEGLTEQSRHRGHVLSLTLIATESQVGIQMAPREDATSSQ
jgi:hypothetical protein